MEYVAIILIVLGLAIYISRSHKKKEEASRRKAEILRIAYKAQDILDNIKNIKSSSAKVNSCKKAREVLLQATVYLEYQEVIKNYDEIIERLEAIEKVLPVVEHIEKSYKQQFKGKGKSELNCLQDALYEIQMKDITNRDFEIAMVFPEGTGELITVEGIKERCIQLGWSPT